MRDVAHNAIEEAFGAHQTGGTLDTGYSTQDYVVGIGYPDGEAEESGRLMYLVVNKNTGVIELANTCLPDTIGLMNRMQDALNKYQVPPELPLS